MNIYKCTIQPDEEISKKFEVGFGEPEFHVTAMDFPNAVKEAEMMAKEGVSGVVPKSNYEDACYYKVHLSGTLKSITLVGPYGGVGA